MRNSYQQLTRCYEWWLIHRLLLLFGNVFFWFLGRQSKSGRIDLTQIRRVLVVRLDEIGDLVLTTPFLRELRRNLPGASITLLVSKRTRNLVELCPHVDEVVTFEPPGPGLLRSVRALRRALRLARDHLWRRHFDLAVAPRWDHDSYYGSMVTYLSGARHRIGYSEHVAEEKRRLNPGLHRLLTHSINESAVKHEVERGLDLIRLLGGAVSEDRVELWVGEEDELFADRLLQHYGIQSDTLLLAVGPGAGHPKRMWPISNFVELGTWFKEVFDGFVVVVGSNADKPLGEELRIRLGATVIDGTGRTTLRQTATLLRRCHLFIGSDAGPMHMAAAAERPVVEISCHPLGGSPGHTNSPVRFGPWRVPHVILRPERSLPGCYEGCHSDQAHCIRGVSVEQVKQALAILLPRSFSGHTTPATVSHRATT
jgi:ADP-heptose:LPS heptosyltransferase